MKKTSLILGIIAGVFGFFGSIMSLFIGDLGSAFKAEESSGIIFNSVIAIFLSIAGLVGASIVMKKTKTAGALMLIAGIDGLMAISGGYIIAGPLFIIAGIFALIESKKENKSKKKTGWIWFLIGFAIFILIMASGQGSKEFSHKEIQSVGLNQEIQVGNIKWKIVKAEDKGKILKSNNMFEDDKTTNGKFILVSFLIENLGKEKVLLGESDSNKIIDDQGREYKQIDDSYFFIDENKRVEAFKDINPNLPYEYDQIYEVAEDSTGLKMWVGEMNFFSDKHGLVELGI